MSNWTCARCGHTYDPDQGDIRHGVMGHTAWVDLPEHWTCPDCGAPKIDFTNIGGGEKSGSGWIIS
jgi:rubredoxin